MSNKGRILEQKCPSCQAPLRFDAETGMLVCDHCGTVLSVLSEEEIAEQTTAASYEKLSGFDFSALHNQIVKDDAEKLPVYHCSSCGAEVISDWQQVALTCPYCQNNIVLTDKVAGSLRPDGVVPFRITSDKLPNAVNNFYRGKRLLSKKFFSEATMGNVTGVYVPFWIFSGNLNGKVYYSGDTTYSYRSEDYNVTETNHYRLERGVSIDFDRLPVDASVKLDNALMDSLEPFNLKDLKPFDPGYLAGFTADRFDEEPDDVEKRAKRRMMNTAYAAARKDTSRFSQVRQLGADIRADIDAKYVLLPVYIFDIEHGGKKYSFAVNGQTGKVVGNLPDDKAQKVRFFLSRVAMTGAAVVGISLVRFFMGR